MCDQVPALGGLHRLLSERHDDPHGAAGHPLRRDQVRQSAHTAAAQAAPPGEALHQAQGQGPVARRQHEHRRAHVDTPHQARHADQLLRVDDESAVASQRRRRRHAAAATATTQPLPTTTATAATTKHSTCQRIHVVVISSARYRRDNDKDKYASLAADASLADRNRQAAAAAADDGHVRHERHEHDAGGHIVQRVDRLLFGRLGRLVCPLAGLAAPACPSSIPTSISP